MRKVTLLLYLFFMTTLPVYAHDPAGLAKLIIILLTTPVIIFLSLTYGILSAIFEGLKQGLRKFFIGILHTLPFLIILLCLSHIFHTFPHCHENFLYIIFARIILVLCVTIPGVVSFVVEKLTIWMTLLRMFLFYSSFVLVIVVMDDNFSFIPLVLVGILGGVIFWLTGKKKYKDKTF
ncbi:MAG: hypothetical protein N2643_02675 [Endomicrobia bacterium]|nr:hypothetical protein [Endomicrobiia bacterium]